MKREITYVHCPENKRLVFYLAMEEWLAEHCDGEYLLVWQVPPTVIFGRNQDMFSEVNVEYCRSQNIAMWRRKSGGGCVYSDWGNVMISYISPGTDVTSIFQRYLQNLTSFLQSLSIPAEISGRNDILVDSKKISGNAYSLKSSSSIVHGTLLYDLDFSEMCKAITPSKAKLESKKVKSVEQRVMNLKPYFDAQNISINDLKSRIISYFCKDDLYLTAEQILEVEEIEKSYLNPKFISGENIIGAISDEL